MNISGSFTSCLLYSSILLFQDGQIPCKEVFCPLFTWAASMTDWVKGFIAKLSEVNPNIWCSHCLITAKPLLLILVSSFTTYWWSSKSWELYQISVCKFAFSHSMSGDGIRTRYAPALEWVHWRSTHTVILWQKVLTQIFELKAGICECLTVEGMCMSMLIYLQMINAYVS